MNKYTTSLYHWWGQLSALLSGLWLTFSHFTALRRMPALSGHAPQSRGQASLPLRGLATLRYPHEKLPVPDHGRHRLHNEIDDCIVCDKCARICPVNCIDIKAIRSPQLLGHTASGAPKRLYAERFDIDLSKCCFCGLCTVVCPTECLTMTPHYDYSVSDCTKHVVPFATLSAADAAAHKAHWAQQQASKARETNES